MDIGSFKKRLLITLLVDILVASVVVTCANTQSSTTIPAEGSIRYWPQEDVYLNLNNVTGFNGFSPGFTLTSEWRYWNDRYVLRQLAKEAKSKMVRLFSHVLEPCISWNDTTRTGNFSWTDVDSLVQRIFEIGAEPLITVGFCGPGELVFPPGMSINITTGLPYPESFAAYSREWARHFKAVGLPVRYYEIINEAWYYFYPNRTWNETNAHYFLQLFSASYDALHKENPYVLVGNDASLLRNFLDYWKTQGGKLDLLTFHKYDSDGLNYSDEQGLQSVERTFFDPSYGNPYIYSVSQARVIWGENLPAIASESNWGASWINGTDPRIQQLVGAVWTALMFRGSILSGVNYSCYFTFSASKSWELIKPSGGYGFGMVNHDDNQPWYPYHVQKLIGGNLEIGDRIVETTSLSSDIRSLAWIHADKLNLLIISKADQPSIVNLHGVEGSLAFFKIDNTVSWENPSVQTGVINSAEPIMIKGYTVLLLQI